MKQLLFLLLFPCLCVAQYTGNAGQKITLGEQTTADGLVFRGLAADTTRKPSVDTMAYILLDTNTNIIWQYKKATNNAWTKINLTQADTSSFNYVNTYGTQTVNGAKTFNSAVTATRFNPTASTLTGTGMFLPSSNTLAFTTADVNRLQINADGRVGIGTQTLTGILNIKQVGAELTIQTDNTNVLFEGINRDNTDGIVDYGFYARNGSHKFWTGSYIERMTILNNGNVGIGTINPSVKLQSSISTSGLPATSGTTQTNGALRLSSSATTGIIDFGINGTNPWIQATDFSNLNNNYNLLLNPNGSEVWIGYTDDGARGTYPLQVNGQIFATNATIATSDEKFKENITPLNKGLEIVNKLKPVTFNFIPDTKNNFSEYEEVGFIAQDVDRALSTETFSKSIVKAADDSEPTSTMGLATQNLIPILVKAIQEQQTLIKSLEQRILILENK